MTRSIEGYGLIGLRYSWRVEKKDEGNGTVTPTEFIKLDQFGFLSFQLWRQIDTETFE